MLPAWLTRYIPTEESIRKSKSMHLFGERLYRPNLWRFNRRSAPRALAIGLFWAMIPMPMQMLAAALLAVLLRAHLPTAVGVVWLTNPITMPPIFYANYQLGAWVMRTPSISMPEHLTLGWLADVTVTHWQPLYLGSLIAALALAVLGFYSMQSYCHWSLRRAWRLRRERA